MSDGFEAATVIQSLRGVSWTSHPWSPRLLPSYSSSGW